MAYRLQLSVESCINNVFHISLFKPFVGELGPKLGALFQEFCCDNPIDKPLLICDVRMQLRDDALEPQVLVQWKGQHPKNATWEWKDDFQRAYPDFHLEDKVNFQGMENVRLDEHGASVLRDNVADQVEEARVKPIRDKLKPILQTSGEFKMSR